jgi:hypothetical protein
MSRRVKCSIRPLDPADPKSPDHPSHEGDWLRLAGALGRELARQDHKRLQGAQTEGKNDDDKGNGKGKGSGGSGSA